MWIDALAINQSSIQASKMKAILLCTVYNCLTWPVKSGPRKLCHKIVIQILVMLRPQAGRQLCQVP
jgi:hypothetical protein